MSNLLALSLLGSGMILVIVALRAVLRNLLHRTVFLLLWLLVALRLTVPFVGTSSASIYNLLPKGEITHSAYLAETFYTNNTSEIASVRSEATEASQGTEENRTTSVDGGIILRCLWAGGFVLCFLYFLWIHIRGRLRYRFALPEDGPEFLGKVCLKRSDEVSTPLVYGFFRPVILLPYDFPKKDSKEYEQVLYHELTHVRSGDLWYKLVMLLVTCLHWFNPLVWLMLCLSTQDLEIRCDARVIRKLGKKKTYAMTLVQAEVRRGYHFTEAAFAFSMTENRLKAISKTKVYLPRSIILCSLLAVVLGCCFSTGPMAEAAGAMRAEITTAHSVPSTTFFRGLPVLLERPPRISEETETVDPTEEEISVSVPAEGDTDMWEEYGLSIRADLGKGESKTYCLSLPEQTTYTLNYCSGFGEGENTFRVDTWYDRESCALYITVTGEDTGSGVISFFIDGEYRCEIDVSVGYRIGSVEEEHQVELTFDYTSLENMDMQTTLTAEELSDLFQDGFSFGGNP